MRRFAAKTIPAVVLLVVLSGIAFQIWVTLQSIQQVEHIAARLALLEGQGLADEKIRQEALSLEISNDMQAFFWNRVIVAFGPLVTAIVALSGAWLGLRKYLDAREKERSDLAVAELTSALKDLTSSEARVRAMGSVGLQHFFTLDKSEYHLRALSALLTAARLETDAEVLRVLRIAAQQAVQNLADDVLRQVSWQGAKLPRVNFAGHDLHALDLRDAVLEDSDLRRCDLTGACLTNARLNGARLDDSCLRQSNLAYADLAGASLVGADLKGADLHNVKVSRMNVERADLQGALLDPSETPWELMENWRRAVLDPELAERLQTSHGPMPKGTRVLMLMWEVPPLVAGGTWTACYHLVRNLRQRGCDITIVVPWDDPHVVPSPFGAEVEVVRLGMEPLRYPFSPYSDARGGGVVWSPYTGTGAYRALAGPYGTTGAYSPYWGIQRSPWDVGPYGTADAHSPYSRSDSSPWDSVSSYGAVGRPQGRSTILRLIEEFRDRLKETAKQRAFDVVHAHDWVTFDAADAVAREASVPWVAHFHSTEGERRALDPDAVIRQIEHRAAHAAARVVTASHITSRHVQEAYQIPSSKIAVIPNVLSAERVPVSEMGSFDTLRVIFLGRLTLQKGPDLFAAIATEFRRRHPDSQFSVYGTGEEMPRLLSCGSVTVRGPLEWASRGSAFSGASAVVVPSRAEPFGMVVLEAMQHRVPVLYAKDAGVSETLRSGIRISPGNTQEIVQELEGLLLKWEYWEQVVEEQSADIADYQARGYERRLQELWRALCTKDQSVVVDSQ